MNIKNLILQINDKWNDRRKNLPSTNLQTVSNQQGSKGNAQHTLILITVLLGLASLGNL